MNKDRRKEINQLIAELEDLKSRVESVLEEEQEYLDNMPESFQEGEKGEKAQAAIEALENTQQSIEEAIDNLNTAAE